MIPDVVLQVFAQVIGASASGRTLREVAREHGVDDATLDLRKIAAGSSASGG